MRDLNIFSSEFSNDISMVILKWEWLCVTKKINNDKYHSKNNVTLRGTFCENITKGKRRIWQILWKGIVFIQFFKFMTLLPFLMLTLAVYDDETCTYRGVVSTITKPYFPSYHTSSVEYYTRPSL
jgi:hypothetical protein